jgi:hypothetical protein
MLLYLSFCVLHRDKGLMLRYLGIKVCIESLTAILLYALYTKDEQRHTIGLKYDQHLETGRAKKFRKAGQRGPKLSKQQKDNITPIIDLINS